ncbi:hypothetical protein [Xanthomonas campestris]|nr:hypothetical protein [Xanthomonas campestris]
MIGAAPHIVTVEDGDRADATPQFTGVACAPGAPLWIGEAGR